MFLICSLILETKFGGPCQELPLTLDFLISLRSQTQLFLPLKHIYLSSKQFLYSNHVPLTHLLKWKSILSNSTYLLLSYIFSIPFGESGPDLSPSSVCSLFQFGLAAEIPKTNGKELRTFCLSILFVIFITVLLYTPEEGKDLAEMEITTWKMRLYRRHTSLKPGVL